MAASISGDWFSSATARRDVRGWGSVVPPRAFADAVRVGDLAVANVCTAARRGGRATAPIRGLHRRVCRRRAPTGPPWGPPHNGSHATRKKRPETPGWGRSRRAVLRAWLVTSTVWAGLDGRARAG